MTPEDQPKAPREYSKPWLCGPVNGRHTHGMRNSPEYKTWCNMKARCYNPKSSYYVNYGGRGIKVCGRWLNSFANFLADMGPKPSPKHSLDRVDVNKGYDKQNCRWATRLEQARNTRGNKRFTMNGVTKSLVEWSEVSGISYGCLQSRIYRNGMTIEEAIKRPLRGGQGKGAITRKRYQGLLTQAKALADALAIMTMPLTNRTPTVDGLLKTLKHDDEVGRKALTKWRAFIKLNDTEK